MTAPRVEQYVRDLFQGSSVSVEVISDIKTIEKEYPLFAAVNRCANGKQICNSIFLGLKIIAILDIDVDRHAGRVIYLRYKGSGPIEKTIYLVGKGVTYDTGGCDIKAGGIMAGMHRDKCGSAAVAAFMKVVDELKPVNVEVVGAMAMVRNSVGSNAYVSDEIITSRAGVRVRVGNTDAEGRMAMADVLCKV
jgi:leucyl aminopeptidase